MKKFIAFFYAVWLCKKCDTTNELTAQTCKHCGAHKFYNGKGEE